MARPQQDAIETFMSITGASEAMALQKLEEHAGDLNAAVNAYFNDGERTMIQPAPVPVPQNGIMDLDDPIELESHKRPHPLFSPGSSLHPFSLLDQNFVQSLFGGRGDAEVTSCMPRASHPRDVREIPIEFKDGDSQRGHSGPRPIIEDVTGSVHVHGPEIHGGMIIEGEDGDLPITAHAAQAAGQREREDDSSGDDFHGRDPGSSVPRVNPVGNYENEIEDEMLQAAIEASKQEAAEAYKRKQFGALDSLSDPQLEQSPSPSEDVELARAVSLSLKTAEQEKALREQGLIGTTEPGILDVSGVEDLERMTSIGRQGIGSSNKATTSQTELEVENPSIQEEREDIEYQPLVRHRSRSFTSGAAESVQEVGQVFDSPPSSPGLHGISSHVQQNGDAFHSDEWGGISSEEHDEAVMLEAALFGGIPEGSYQFAYPPHQALRTGSDRNAGSYPRTIPRPLSPTLTAQRLLREQQDDEYLASLQADREKELKTLQEAEIRRLEEAAAREAALEEKIHQEEKARWKLLEEEEFERQLAVKEASLPQEPALDDESAVTLLVRMPDGSRRGRRFLKSDRLQALFDLIDVGRGVKPGTYRLVRPYPRHAFTVGESGLSLSELGLTSKQEALFLELI